MRVGRPTKAPEPGERIQIGVQVTPELKRRLEAAGTRNHRALSREAEHRLERSFEREDLLPDVLADAFPKPVAGLLLALGLVMTNAGLHDYWARAELLADVDDRWLNDPTAFDQAIRAAVSCLNAARPAGEVLSSEASTGALFAEGLISAICRDPAQDDPFGPRHLGAIRSLLGPIRARMAEATES